MTKPEPDHPEIYTASFDRIYSRFAGIYDFLVKHTSLWEAWEGPIIPLIRGPRGLEVSFGLGWLITRYADSFETYGIDFNMRMVRITSRNLAAAGISIPLQRANVEALPYRSETFDTLVNTMAFSGYPRADKAMSEFRRVLKPGGRVILMDIGLPEDGNWIGRFLVRLYEATGDIARDMGSFFHGMGSHSLTRQLVDVALSIFMLHRRIRSDMSWCGTSPRSHLLTVTQAVGCQVNNPLQSKNFLFIMRRCYECKQK